MGKEKFNSRSRNAVSHHHSSKKTEAKTRNCHQDACYESESNGILKLFRNYRRFSQTEIRCEELAGDGEREVGLVPLPTLSFLKVGSVNQPSSGTSTPPLSSDDGAVYDWDLDCSCSRSPRPSELTKQIHSEVQAQDVFGSVVHIV